MFVLFTQGDLRGHFSINKCDLSRYLLGIATQLRSSAASLTKLSSCIFQISNITSRQLSFPKVMWGCCCPPVAPVVFLLLKCRLLWQSETIEAKPDLHSDDSVPFGSPWNKETNYIHKVYHKAVMVQGPRCRPCVGCLDHLGHGHPQLR